MEVAMVRMFDSGNDYWLRWKHKFDNLSRETKTKVAKNLINKAFETVSIEDINTAFDFICEARPIYLPDKSINDVKRLAIMADDFITYHNAMVVYSNLFPERCVPVPEPLFKKYTECLYAHAVAEFGLDNQEQIKSLYKSWLDLSHKKGGLNKLTVMRYHLDDDEYLSQLRKKYIQKQKKSNEIIETL